MASAADEDLVASKTDGFKVGEKKTVEEYAKLGEPTVHSSYSTSSVVRPPFTWLLHGIHPTSRSVHATSFPP